MNAMQAQGPAHGYAPGSLLNEGRYRVDKEVNRGATAIVYAAWDTQTGNKVALKARGEQWQGGQFMARARPNQIWEHAGRRCGRADDDAFCMPCHALRLGWHRSLLKSHVPTFFSTPPGDALP